MKASIDEDRCRGHGVCWSICPEVFNLTDEGYAEVILAEIPGTLETAAKDAADNCPEHAITLS